MEKDFHETIAGLTVSPYIVELVQTKRIKSPGKVLEIGTDNGANAIFLSQQGFDVLGIDLSEEAIQFARKNADQAKVKASFLAVDASTLNFLKDMYDVILDWGAFHALAPERRFEYLSQLTEHTTEGAKIVLRVYSDRDAESGDDSMALGRKRYFFSEKEINEAFGKNFKIVEHKESDVSVGGITSAFDYYLLEKLW